MVPVSNAKKFEKDLSRVELKIYKDIGHLPMEEAPQRVGKDILGFLLKDNQKEIQEVNTLQEVN